MATSDRAVEGTPFQRKGYTIADSYPLYQEEHTLKVNRRKFLGGLSGGLLFLIKPNLLLANSGDSPPKKDLISTHDWLLSLVEKDGFDRTQLNTLLSPLTPDSRVVRLMNNQAESLPYHLYRKHVLNDLRIKKGQDRMLNHRQVLLQIEKQFQVPATILVALWGIESDFGDNVGHFSVLRTLYTLSTHYPRRAPFFQRQLRQFLLLCREEGWNPSVPKGSYAGAMGQVQMIPGTLRQYAVDFNGDGKRDVFHTIEDILASIATFLHKKGWNHHEKLSLPLNQTSQLSTMVSSTLSDMPPWKMWRAQGVLLADPTLEPPLKEPAALIRLEEKGHLGYHMVFGNFRVITRWNRSNRFAMVVREFADHLQKVW